MAKKTKKAGTRVKATGASAVAQRTAALIKRKWEATVKSVTAAEAQLEKQLRQLVKQKKLDTRAAAMLKDVRHRLERERKRAAKDLSARVAAVQTRLQHERRNLSSLVDDAVHGALRGLNIPSRQEIGQLTRKVDELSRKIDSFPRRARARRSA